MVAGIFGCLAIGFFGTSFTTGSGDSAFTWGAKGLFYGGGWDLLGVQALGAFSVLAYSFVVTLVIALILKKLMGLRIDPDAEVAGIDLDQHLESAYDFTSTVGGVLGPRTARVLQSQEPS